MKKKVLIAVSYLLILALGIMGTVAYFTDREAEVNVFTVGDVALDLNWDNSSAELMPGKSIDKEVVLDNVGGNDAWVWATIAVPALLDGGNASGKDAIHFEQNTTDWEWTLVDRAVELEGETGTYNVYTVMHTAALASAGKTNPLITKVYMDTHVDITPNGDLYWVEDGDTYSLEWNVNTLPTPKVLVSAYAIQKDTFNTVEEGYAAYNKQWTPIPGVEVDGTADFAEVKDLLESGESIHVTEDLTLDNSDKYLNINDDVEIYVADGATLTFEKVVVLSGTGKVTVKNGSIATPQEFCTSGDTTLVIDGGEHTFGAFSATGNGKIIVNGGILNCMGSYAGVMGISFGENGSLVVNGGKLNMYQPFNLNANRCDKAYIEINGGHIELLNGMADMIVVRNKMDKDVASGVLRGSSVRISGGTFVAHYAIDSDNDATAFIRNGDSPCDTNKVLVSNANGYDCVVTGGTFYGSWQRADNQRYVNGNGGNSDGQFVENTIAGFVADGYQITGDMTNGYVVSAK